MFSDAMESGFSVVEEVEIGDLTHIQEEVQLIPPTKKVKLKIKKVENSVNESKTWYSLNIQFQLVDGIDESGKYKGKVVFGRVTYKADPNGTTKDGKTYKNCDWYQKGGYLADFQMLYQGRKLPNGTFVAPALTITDGTKVNDALFSESVGQVVLADIIQKEGSDGYPPKNEVKNFRAVPAESMV